MNYLRTRQPVNRFLIAVIIGSIALGAVGCLLIVLAKNRQIKLAREIRQVAERTGGYVAKTRAIRYDTDDKLNLYIIRLQLDKRGTTLRQIPQSAVEVIDPTRPPPPRPVAPAQP